MHFSYIKRGEKGSLYIQHDESLLSNGIMFDTSTSNKLPIFEYNKENDIFYIFDNADTNYGNIYESKKIWMQRHEFHIMKMGIMKNIHILDTTGAGDAFIGGIIFHSLLKQLGLHQLCNLSKKDKLQFAMMLSTWVAGKKLEGLGSRQTLPNGHQILIELGSSITEIQKKLKEHISS